MSSQTERVMQIQTVKEIRVSNAPKLMQCGRKWVRRWEDMQTGKTQIDQVRLKLKICLKVTKQVKLNPSLRDKNNRI